MKLQAKYERDEVCESLWIIFLWHKLFSQHLIKCTVIHIWISQCQNKFFIIKQLHYSQVLCNSPMSAFHRQATWLVKFHSSSNIIGQLSCNSPMSALNFWIKDLLLYYKTHKFCVEFIKMKKKINLVVTNLHWIDPFTLTFKITLTWPTNIDITNSNWVTTHIDLLHHNSFKPLPHHQNFCYSLERFKQKRLLSLPVMVHQNRKTQHALVQFEYLLITDMWWCKSSAKKINAQM